MGLHMSSEKPAPKLKIRQIKLDLHVHATENKDIVEKALENFFPFDLDPKILSIQNLTGTYGNPILGYELTLSTKKYLTAALPVLSRNLLEFDKVTLGRELEQRTDEKYNFYFRLSKQAFICGRLELAQNTKDIIKVVVSIHNMTPYTPVEITHIKDFLRNLEIII
jgi:RNA binding exosome subunit